MPLVLDGNGDITGLVAGALPSTVIGAGAVLQIVTGSTNARQTNSTDQFSDTNLSVSITPLFSTSKILLIGHQADCFKDSGTSSNSIFLRLVRGSTEILLFADRALLTASSGQEMMMTIPFHFLDSPATTSSTTYKTQFRNTTNNSFVSVQQQSSSSSIIIAMEIAA
jgi:hypothetical protein